MRGTSANRELEVGSTLVAAGWLAARIGDPDLIVVDMRWREDGSARTLYDLGHIPGARFLDWSVDIVDPEHEFEFMLSPPARFSATLARLGASDDTTVVAYSDGLGSGPFRLWWAFLAYGHHSVRILDGGLGAWIEAGLPLSSGPELQGPRTGSWAARPTRGLSADADAVAAVMKDPAGVLIDSRPVDQFIGNAVWFETGPVLAGDDGIANTPRGPLRAGHIPGARSIPAALIYRRDGRMKEPGELRELFAPLGVTPRSRAITYCGVGISAAALLFALRSAGVEDSRLYDASWEEWGRDRSRPVER